MAYDEGLAQRIREVLNEQANVVEKKMFGGIAFMVNGNMCCGVMQETLMLRVGPEQYDKVLALPHTQPMDFTGKPMKGMVYVAPSGIETDTELEDWVQYGLNFVSTLPAK